MTDPKETVPERFVDEDLTGLRIDRSQEEGEPFDMSDDPDGEPEWGED